MTKSVTKIQDKDTGKRISVVRSTEDPTKYGIVMLNPDGTKISGPKGEAATVNVGNTTTSNPGTDASVENSGTENDAILDFTIPRGSIVSVGNTTTGEAGTSASVENSGTDGDVVLNFTIPKGDKGDKGDEGNGIESVTSSKVGKTTTVTISFTDGSTPYSFQILDGEGAGDVVGPGSSVNDNIVIFDGASGKMIKDSGVKLSDKQDKLSTQTEYISKGTSSKVPQITTNNLGQVTGITEVNINYPSQVSDIAFGSSWDGVTGNAPSKDAVYDKIKSIDDVIPSEATSSNQLADKNYVNDSINSVTAYYITKNAQGAQFATYSELASATTFYSGGVARVPTRNDYTIVLDDENHDHATTRYIYNSDWEYQYTVNETALTQAQLNALNSGITSAKVGQYDTVVATIGGYGDIVTHNANEFLTTDKISDTAYGASWDGVTGIAPSKNAVYDKISAMDTTIEGKADSSSLEEYIKKTNTSTQAIETTSGTTALGVKSASATSSYISYTGTSWLGSIGVRVNGNKKVPTFYDGNTHDLAYVSDLPTVLIYGTSSTAGATAEKVVSIPAITELNVGQVIIVHPTTTNTVASSTIKLNSFDAYPMRYNNAAITTSTDSIVWNANYLSMFMFDGTYWQFLGHGLDSNTTYSNMSATEANTGTATNARTISASVLKGAIETHAPVESVNGQTGAVVLDSDDISQGSTNLYVTSAEKSNWNGKQDALTQGTGISISGNTISNTGVISVNGNTGAVTVQATISDLSTIRTNAANGATVVSGDSGTTYTIKKSTVAPSGAGSNTITLVVE